MRRQGRKVPHHGADGRKSTFGRPVAGGMVRDMTTFLSLSQEVLLSMLSFALRAASTAFRPASVVTRHAVA